MLLMKAVIILYILSLILQTILQSEYVSQDRISSAAVISKPNTSATYPQWISRRPCLLLIGKITDVKDSFSTYFYIWFNKEGNHSILHTASKNFCSQVKHITTTQILLVNTSHLTMPKLKNKTGGICSEDLEIFRECLGTFT